MRITVLYFASLRDRAGVGTESYDLPEGSTVEGLWSAACARHAALRGLGAPPLAACDLDHADYRRRLDGVREVAFLPPVSGG